MLQAVGSEQGDDPVPVTIDRSKLVISEGLTMSITAGMGGYDGACNGKYWNATWMEKCVARPSDHRGAVIAVFNESDTTVGTFQYMNSMKNGEIVDEFQIQSKLPGSGTRAPTNKPSNKPTGLPTNKPSPQPSKKGLPVAETPVTKPSLEPTFKPIKEVEPTLKPTNAENCIPACKYSAKDDFGLFVFFLFRYVSYLSVFCFLYLSFDRMQQNLQWILSVPPCFSSSPLIFASSSKNSSWRMPSQATGR